MTEHKLILALRPAACTCGHASFAGSPTFIRKRFAVHLEDVAARNPNPLPPLRDHGPEKCDESEASA